MKKEKIHEPVFTFKTNKANENKSFALFIGSEIVQEYSKETHTRKLALSKARSEIASRLGKLEKPPLVRIFQ